MAETETDDAKEGKNGKKGSEKKWLIVGGIGTIVLIFLTLRNGSSSSTGSSSATPVLVPSGGSTGSSSGGSGYGASNAAALSGLAADMQTLQAEISGLTPPSKPTGGSPNGGAGTGTTTTTTTTTPTTTTSSSPPPSEPSQPSIPANPYTVGTVVAPGESIVQSIYDPAKNTWVNLTSKGGIYTSAGLPLSGSGIGNGTNNYSGGTLQLTNGGTGFVESNGRTSYSGTIG